MTSKLLSVPDGRPLEDFEYGVNGDCGARQAGTSFFVGLEICSILRSLTGGVGKGDPGVLGVLGASGVM